MENGRVFNAGMSLTVDFGGEWREVSPRSAQVFLKSAEALGFELLPNMGRSGVGGRGAWLRMRSAGVATYEGPASAVLAAARVPKTGMEEPFFGLLPQNAWQSEERRLGRSGDRR